jgi:type II secretion system protein H
MFIDPRNTSRRRRNSRSGFTLIELVLVLAIVGVVAAIATPRYASAVSRFNADTVARRVCRDLTLARSTAFGGGTPQSVTFDTGANQYTVGNLSHPDHPGVAYVVRLDEVSSPAQLVVVDFAGSKACSFDTFGLPVSGGTVVMKVGNAQRTIVVDGATGRIGVQ